MKKLIDLEEYTYDEVFGSMDIDSNNLTQEFSAQASTYAYYALQLAEADYKAGIATSNREQTYANLDKVYRDAFMAAGKKVTETQLTSAVTDDEDYQAAKAAELEAKHKVRVLKAVVDALQMRADMLISLGAQTRSEMGMVGMRTNEVESTIVNTKDRIQSLRDIHKP